MTFYGNIIVMYSNDVMMTSQCIVLLHFVLVSSLTKSSNDPRELYLGLLYPTEDYKVYPDSYSLIPYFFALFSALFSLFPVNAKCFEEQTQNVANMN